jgi:hypothetical protein
MFFFPPFTLHKIWVDEQARDGYRRTIIHLDQHAVLKVLRDLPHTCHLAKLSIQAAANMGCRRGGCSSTC